MIGFRRASKVEELLGLNTEVAVASDELADIAHGALKRSNGRVRELKDLLEDILTLRTSAVKDLKRLGVKIVEFGTSGSDVPQFVPVVPYQSRPQVTAPVQQQPEPPSKWRQYAAYAVAGGLIAAGIFGAWVFFVPFKGGKQNQTYASTEPTNNMPYQNQTPEIPQTQQNQTSTNQTPINDTPIIPPAQQNQTQTNQTPNQTLEDVVNTPDYLKYLRGVFTGDTFFGNYGIADAEHNADGNYTLRVRDTNNRTIFETDLNDSESDHGRFWFGTNGFKQNTDYFVEVLRNGTLAHEPLKFMIPNSPPEVMISADVRLSNNNYRAINYTLRVSDDREVVDAEISLVNASGGNVIQLEKFNINKQGLRLNGVLLADKNVPAGQYHVLAKARDNEGSYSEAVVDVDLPELPAPPPPPPPPPHVNVPPQIVGVAWAYDKDRDKFVADVDVNDPDGPNLSLEQKLLDNSSNVSAPMTSQVSGSRIHSEINAQGLDSVYDWNLTVKDGANGTATQILKNVWAWMRGLAGYWKFDGNGADYIKGNNATLQNGAGFAQGKRGQALSLDGMDDFAEIQHSAVYDSQSFSVSIWFNASQLLGKDYRQPVQKYGFGGNPAGFRIVTADSQDALRVYLTVNDQGIREKRVGETPTLQTNSWYHFVFVYDNSKSLANIYLNNQLVSSQAVVGTLSLSDSPIKLGYKYEQAGSNQWSFWDGSLDDFKFYTRPLSAKEVQAIFTEN